MQSAFEMINRQVHNYIKRHRPNDEVHVVFSVYQYVTESLDEVALPHNSQIRAEDHAYDYYQSEIIDNPTWLDLCVFANDMIQITGDYHHVFLEGVENKGQEGNTGIYEFVMGS